MKSINQRITVSAENPLAMVPGLQLEELVFLRDELEKLIKQKQQGGQAAFCVDMPELAHASEPVVAFSKSTEEEIARKKKNVELPSKGHAAAVGKDRVPMAIIDFETTGLSPGEGARATEIAAVIWQKGRVARRYQSLMNAGVYVPSFITSLTGITNDMVRSAPSASKVMNEVADFVGDLPLIAHNASFDRKFWDAELALIGRTRRQEFACSMLTARRVYPKSPNHKLGTLAAFAELPSTGKAHRALADAEMTVNLLCHMEATLVEKFQIQHLSHAMLRALQKTNVSNVHACLKKFI